MCNRRGQCPEFTVIWSLDKTGYFTIGVYNTGEWKHPEEKGHTGMFQSGRWTHVSLLNLLTFKWRLALWNLVQRMSRRLLRACGDASQCRVHTSSRERRVATVYSQRLAWMRIDVIPLACCVTSERRLSVLLLSPFHYNFSEYIYLVFVYLMIVSLTDNICCHTMWWSENDSRC
jgi:hypothetical protein